MAGAGLASGAAGGYPVLIFSKHLHWTKDYREMAQVARDLGFDGIDLTVRPGGHVEPERVAEDLPKAVEAARAAGLIVPMITSGIVDASTPHAEVVLKTASALGIRDYRWGGFRFTPDGSITKELDALQPKVAALEQLNDRYGMSAMYHTHSGPNQVGAAFWDLWLLLRDRNPRRVGVNFDIGHATIEGGYGDWVTSLRLLAPFVRGTAVKDFRWERNASGAWRPRWCPIGEGMVDFPLYFRMLRAVGFRGPLQLHYEYPELGGADGGRKQLTAPKDLVLAAMRRDLEAVRGLLVKSGLG